MHRTPRRLLALCLAAATLMGCATLPPPGLNRPPVPSVPASFDELLEGGKYWGVNYMFRSDGEGGRLFDVSTPARPDKLRPVQLPDRLDQGGIIAALAARGLQPGTFSDLVVYGYLIGQGLLAEQTDYYRIVAPGTTLPPLDKCLPVERCVSAPVLIGRPSDGPGADMVRDLFVGAVECGAEAACQTTYYLGVAD